MQCYFLANAQSNSLQDNFCEELLFYQFDDSTISNNFLNSTQSQNPFQKLSQLIYHSGTNQNKDSIAVFSYESKEKNHREYVISEILKAYYYFHYHKKSKKMVEQIENAVRLAKGMKDPCLEKLTLLIILNLYARENSMPPDSFDFYIQYYNKISKTEIEKAWSVYYKNLYESYSILNSPDYEKTALESIDFFHKHEDHLSLGLKSRFYEIIGGYFRYCKEYDSAYYYLRKNVELPNQPHFQKVKFHANLDLGAISMALEKPEESKKYFENSKKSISYADSLFSLATYYRFKSIYHDKKLGLYENAFDSLLLANWLQRNLDYQNINLTISQQEVESRTAEKDKQRLRNQNIAIALGGGLLTVSLIGFLLFKNTKRKQRIAEQEKELEIQKTEKILKEQELTTIDAMIEGQEKERQRLASDLHDSVGATLSAARLQFDHINKNKDKLGTLDELFEKTGSLLDDAYNEVRSMAHLKNSGVIAKNGLLPAVEKLAKNASGTNKLKVEVQDFGLEDRLENSLEITIFRIIQELITNVIKHANASEATISITQHKDSLSIIVEDNGRGFDAQKFQQKEGMGLSGIERRIEHLEGTLEVDSSPGNGTSVLIDIPL